MNLLIILVIVAYCNRKDILQNINNAYFETIYRDGDDYRQIYAQQFNNTIRFIPNMTFSYEW
jgi:hypothetical protein